MFERKKLVDAIREVESAQDRSAMEISTLTLHLSRSSLEVDRLREQCVCPQIMQFLFVNADSISELMKTSTIDAVHSVKLAQDNGLRVHGDFHRPYEHDTNSILHRTENSRDKVAHEVEKSNGAENAAIALEELRFQKAAINEVSCINLYMQSCANDMLVADKVE